MIFEILKTQFDIEKLQRHIYDHVLKLEPVQQSSSFGGWSVFSSNSSYKDGWHMGHKKLTPDLSLEECMKALASSGAKKGSEYILPTEICHGYLMEVVEKIKGMGFAPQRVRIIKLTAGLASAWHRDMPDNIDCVRLHVPIITNPGCFFEIEGNQAHMPATGDSYLVRVNRLHRVVNRGTKDRYHMVMDIVDHKGISEFHRVKSDD